MTKFVPPIVGSSKRTLAAEESKNPLKSKPQQHGSGHLLDTESDRNSYTTSTARSEDEFFASSGVDPAEILHSSMRGAEDLSDSLRRSTRDSIICEPKTSTRENTRRMRQDFSMNRLRFSKLGKLYGREAEIKQLRGAFSNVLIDQCCLMLIEGSSGTGKSALAAELRPAAARAQGLYVSGKFDLSQTTEPYSALKQAMSQLVQELLDLQHSESTRQRFESIQARLLQDKASISLLSTLVPKLTVLLGDDTDSANDSNSSSTGGGKESVDRLNFAFRKLIQAVTLHCPLVLVCDDLQWCDTASIALIKSLITDTENQSLMIVGCYRSNLVDENHLVSQTVQDIRLADRGITIDSIELGDLDQTSVHEMITDVLNLDLSATADLADTVYHKSNGNVFYVIQFMLSLVGEDLLSFNAGSMTWTWNDAEVREKSMATSNVVELLKDKLRQNDVATVVLPVAACLGAQFTSDAICIAMTALYPDFEEGDIRGMLEDCEDSGFLESNGIGSFGFAHDKVQEASMELLPGDELTTLKIEVGDALFSTLPTACLDELIFVVANLLNAENGTVDPGRMLEIAKLNYQAGIMAVRYSGFEAASRYFEQALDLLPVGHWTSHYKLRLGITTSAAEAAYCVGKFDAMQSHCETVLQQENVSLLTRLQIFNLLIDGALAKNQHAVAIKLSYEALLEAGVDIPRSKAGITFGMLSGLLKFKRNPRKTIDTISELPVTSDPLQKLISKGIDKLGRVGYLAGQPELLALCCIVNLKRCFRHGVTPHTSLSMSLLAFLVTCVANDFQTGLQYGDLSLMLLDKVGDNHVESITVFTVTLFVHHWTKPYQGLFETVLSGYRTGMQTGDIESGCYCSYYTMYLSFMCARPLESFEDDVNMFSNQMHDFGQDVTFWYLTPVLQAVMNLRGKSSNTTVLTGDAMDEQTIWDLAEDKGATKSAAIILKIELAAFFGEFEVGAKLALEHGEKIAKLMVGLPNSISCRFAGSLCLFACARNSSSKSRKMERVARKYRAILKGWLKQGNPNVAARLALLDAEAAAVGKKSRAAVVEAYKAAIKINGRQGLIHYQALCNERLADYYRNLGELDDAHYCLSEAAKLYTEWGAFGKVRPLQEQIRELQK